MIHSCKTLRPHHVSINIKGLFGEAEKIESRFYYIGCAYLDEQKLSAVSLYNLTREAVSAGTLKQFILELSGFFSFIINDSDVFVLASDKTRSKPLLYAFDENKKMHVSDSAIYLARKTNKQSLIPLSEQEFQQAGYVTGENTLIEDVYQVRAGHMLTSKCYGFEQVAYYKFIPMNGNKHVADEKLCMQLDDAMKAAINQLIDYAGGRQVVVPLSGGYDSRAIAVYLKQSGYPNVLTFTFGKKNSKEVLISKQVAEKLGFEWHLIEYDKKRWKVVQKSDEFEQYLSFISNYISVPNIQVYPALKALLHQKIIHRNALIVPGHTGDFVSGGHIPHQLINLKASTNIERIVDAIIAKHYKNKVKHENRDDLNIKLTDQLRRISEGQEDSLLAVSLFEAWEFYERQAKFIINSNRYYDFFKVDWWMPLWNENIIFFWQKVPLEYRLNSSLWKKFVEDKYNDISGDRLRYGNVNDHYSSPVKKIRSVFDYFTDENDLYALVPFYRWALRKIKYPHAKGSLFGYLAYKLVMKQKKQLVQKGQ
ncbi:MULTISPECIES: asparagine synthase-related protein [Thalassotalea]|uniref:asparagine synthase-related protein n=1 Tax=Thalassotalea TaxID=1518149 RepID=UPI0009423997|nr:MULTISPECIES: asparagine synthase-related protein [Thalassotalea]OKY24650.1 hypothetical protein BI291_05505 [Thalassotalea sp. PP2-459]